MAMLVYRSVMVLRSTFNNWRVCVSPFSTKMVATTYRDQILQAQLGFVILVIFYLDMNKVHHHSKKTPFPRISFGTVSGILCTSIVIGENYCLGGGLKHFWCWPEIFKLVQMGWLKPPISCRVASSFFSCFRLFQWFFWVDKSIPNGKPQMNGTLFNFNITG